MAGYEFQSTGELIRAVRTISLFVAYGLTQAETAEQKQFMLERIAIELGMSLVTMREKLGALPGEPMDIDFLIETWEHKEAGHWWSKP
jgi:hypothetical protein